MQTKTPFSVEDFLQDETFLSWVSNPDSRHACYWNEWSARHPEALATIEEAKKMAGMLQFTNFRANDQQVNEALTRLNHTLDVQEVVTKKTRHNFSKQGYRVAAVLLLLVAFGAFLITTHQKNSTETAFWTEVTAPYGTVKNLILPDQSIVFLNAGSKIRYPKNFQGDTREVELCGEAWFDVHHNETLPFIVHTAETDITVLGTAFNVNAYPGDALHQISLERGKIQISGDRLQKQILLPEQSWLLLRDKNTARVFKTNNIATYSAWRSGKIIFRNTSFEAMTRQLERSHNIRFTIRKDALKQCHYTGEFSMQDDIEKILKIISMTAPFEYIIQDKEIIIQ
ncbi:MAG: DUF4974 domain-containing protein [Bacteroidales bacterium]|nr:DUF4974 domain-containing protein [Bacteroidales bacterium]MDY0285912.1 DUF4974 domain-containing protein [Bacteroidales bacterium]HPE57649.1 DUF4974 domain-containing protein [Bacteroidales bacterium]